MLPLRTMLQEQRVASLARALYSLEQASAVDEA